MWPRGSERPTFQRRLFPIPYAGRMCAWANILFFFRRSVGTDANDYKVVSTIGIGRRKDGSLHMPIVKADIQQAGIDWMLETSWRHEELFKPVKLGVEENSYKDFVRREYKRLMGRKGRPLPFWPVDHNRPKIERIQRLVPLVKEGIITFDKDDPDQELLIRQFKAFPNAGNVSAGGLGDDGPDAVSGCVELAEIGDTQEEIGYKSLGKREAHFKEGSW